MVCRPPQLRNRIIQQKNTHTRTLTYTVTQLWPVIYWFVLINTACHVKERTMIFFRYSNCTATITSLNYFKLYGRVREDFFPNWHVYNNNMVMRLIISFAYIIVFSLGRYRWYRLIRIKTNNIDIYNTYIR